MDNIEDNNFSNLGVIEDPRTEEQKAKDWSHEELAGAVIVNWRPKQKSEWKTYTRRNQAGSSSCVAQSIAKAKEIIDQYTGGQNLIYSAQPIYRRRINYPEGGMYLPNAGEITKKHGTALESDCQSQNLGESAMNREVTVETPYKVFGYVPNINVKDIENVAQAIETHGHLVLIFHCDRDEYLRHKPKYDPKGKIDIGHAICAVDYFIDEEGDKVILIEDSAGLNSTIDGSGRRLITADFLQKRFTSGMYLIPNTAPADDQKPKWSFNKPLKYGMRVEQDVAAFQNILQYEGLFPTTVPSSGNYLDITAKAILAWQRKHAIAPEAELAALKGKTVGPKTRAKLNELYSA